MSKITELQDPDILKKNPCMPPVYLQMILTLILCSASNLTKALAKQEAEHRIKKSQDLPRMI